MANGDIFRGDEVGVGSAQQAVVETTTTASGRKAYGMAALTAGAGGGGDASAANQTTQITALGSITEAVPATDTASSGLNGRLQRIAQRVTSLIALLPASLGIKTAAGSLSIAPASDASFAVTAAALPLPAGAATAANLTSQQTPLTPAAGTATVGLAVGARYDLTVPTWTDTQQGALGVDTRGNLRVSLYSSGSSAGIVGLADNSDAVAVTASTNRLAVAARPSVFNGTSWDRLYGTTAGMYAQGPGATGATAVGNPLAVGALYKTTPLTLTDGQRGDLLVGTRQALKIQMALPDNVNNAGFQGAGADAYANNVVNAYNSFSLGLGFNGTTWDRVRGDTNGLVNQPYALAPSRWAYPAASTGILNTTTAVTIAVAAGIGVRNYLTGVQISWEALTNATEIAIRDGAGGTVLWRDKISAGAAGRMSVSFNNPKKGTANTLMEFVTLTASGVGAVYVNADGYQGT